MLTFGRELVSRLRDNAVLRWMGLLSVAVAILLASGSARAQPAAASAPTWLTELPSVARVQAAYPASEPRSYAVQSAIFAVLVDVIEVRSGVDQALMGAPLVARLSPAAQVRWKEYVGHGYSKILTSSNGSWQAFTSPQFRLSVLSNFIPRASILAYETMRNRTPGVAGPCSAADLARIEVIERAAPPAPPPAAAAPAPAPVPGPAPAPTPAGSSKSTASNASTRASEVSTTTPLWMPTPQAPYIPEKMPTGMTLDNTQKIAWNEDITSVTKKCGSLRGKVEQSEQTMYFCSPSNYMVTFSKEGKFIEYWQLVTERTWRRAVATLIRAYGTESVSATDDREVWRYYYRNQKQDIIGTMTMKRQRSKEDSKWIYVVSFKSITMRGSMAHTEPSGKKPVTETLISDSFPSGHNLQHGSFEFGEKLASVKAKCPQLRTVGDAGAEYFCPTESVYLTFNKGGLLSEVLTQTSRRRWSKLVSEVVERSGTDSREVSEEDTGTTEEWQFEFVDAHSDEVAGTLNLVKITDEKQQVMYIENWVSEKY